jgi:quercetin dioxygenase-like cupin family protein
MSHPPNRLRVPLLVALAAMLSFLTVTATAAQEAPAPQPIDLPCVTNASAQLLNATPVGDGSQTLVLGRIILAPGGAFANHTHPGTLAVTIESGSFGLTLAQQGEMTITRADGSQETMTTGEQYTLAPGDGFIETGMIHSAANLSDGDTTVLLAGLIDTGQPLTICADNATPTT